MTHVDLHQHIYTRALLERLERRRGLPRARQSNGVAQIHGAGERSYAIDAIGESAALRAELVHADGLDRAVIALSSPLGIEALPREESLELIEAHLEGIDGLPAEFDAWGPVALDGMDPDDVDVVLDWGCVGVSLPAGALAGSERLERAEPLLERVAVRGAPLFVHPGPAWGGAATPASRQEPPWWAGLTSYVHHMHDAWLTFASAGRRQHPGLVVVFAMLAACAPLQAERLEARGGPAVNLRDPLTFYETSSYGPAATETMARLVGERQLVYGSDRPVVTPSFTGREAILQTQAAELLARSGVVVG